MARELPNTRPDLERLGSVIDDWDKRKSAALLDLADLLIARAGSTQEWAAWIRKPANRQLANRLLASLTVLRQPPADLAGFDADGPLPDPGRVEALARFATDIGDMGSAREAWALAPSYTGLRKRILAQVQTVDIGVLARLATEGAVAIADLRGVIERAKAAFPEAVQEPRRTQGRPREMQDRDTEVLTVWNTDPHATYKSVADALRSRYPKLSPDVVEQILRRARIRGDEVRRQVGY